jgi:ATP-dependent DNA ligase
MLEKLYKRTSTGKLRTWSVAVHEDTFTVTYGEEGGKSTSKTTKVTGKNIGKANETNAHQQALAEANAKWVRQVERELYTLFEDLGKPPLYLQPQLALDATKFPHRIPWGQVVGSTKMDGCRCLYRPELGRLQSREGTFYDAPEHIIEQLKGVNEPLDGELFLLGTPLNDILGAARKWRPLTDRLEFHAFDIAKSDGDFGERHKDLSDLFFDEGLIAKSHLQIVNYEPVSEGNMFSLHNKYVESGYEGLIIRDIYSEYAFGERTTGIFKFKHFEEAEFSIVGVEEDKDGGAVLVLLTSAGNEFRSRPRGKLEYRRSLMDGKCIGKKATIRYFAMTQTGKPCPQFGVAVAIL